MPYVGRFAPSPTGPLHAGSLVAALASWLDARAHGGRWLVRLEDVDAPRCPPGMGVLILDQLARCGLHPDAPVVWQHDRDALYTAALQQLARDGAVYACRCSRRDIERALAARGHVAGRHGELVYPGTCRPAMPGPVDVGPMRGLHGGRQCAWRLRVPAGLVRWHDRRLGAQEQDVQAAVGDVVLRRADGLWAYQLAVVVDDAAQGVTQVVRGEDLADNTARQIVLQQALGLASPGWLHTPLVLAADGHKLSKQNGATPLALDAPLSALRAAGRVLALDDAGLDDASAVSDWLSRATSAWARRWMA